jgi:hypothetical protein
MKPCADSEPGERASNGQASNKAACEEGEDRQPMMFHLRFGSPLA